MIPTKLFFGEILYDTDYVTAYTADGIGVGAQGGGTNTIVLISNSLNGPWTFGRSWKICKIF